MSFLDKLTEVKKVSHNFTNGQLKEFAMRASISTNEELREFFKGELGGGEDNTEKVHVCMRAAWKAKSLISPVASLALRTNPDKAEHYAQKPSTRKEALMAELLTIIKEEQVARAQKAASKRAENQAKKAGGIV